MSWCNLISIVIPVYNEEDNVLPLYHSISNTMSKRNHPYEIIFVDDGSLDKTLLNLKSILSNGYEKNNGTLRILELQRNYGQTPALLAGFAKVTGDIIVTLDGDLQNDPKDIPKLLDALTNEYDVICGWRKNRQDNSLKKIPSKFNNFLNRRFNNLSVHDSGCTLRSYRREAIDGLQLFAEGHRYIPAILSKKGYRIGEIETNHKPRTMGKTKYCFRRLFRGFNDLLTLRAMNKWGTKPGHLFNLWAVVFISLSFLSGIWALFEQVLFYRFWKYYLEPVTFLSNPLVTMGLILFLFGILLIFIGFLAELFYRKTTDTKNSFSIKKEWN